MTLFSRRPEWSLFFVCNTCVGIFFHLEEDARAPAILIPSAQM